MMDDKDKDLQTGSLKRGQFRNIYSNMLEESFAVLSWILGRLSTELNVNFVSQFNYAPAFHGHLQSHLHEGILALSIAHVHLNDAEYLGSLLLHDLIVRSDHRLLYRILFEQQSFVDLHSLDRFMITISRTSFH